MAKIETVVPNAVPGYSKKSAKEEKVSLQNEERQKDKLKKLVEKLRQNAKKTNDKGA